MSIRFTCPFCGKTTNVGDEYAGQSGPCSSCGQAVTIPGGKPVSPLEGKPLAMPQAAGPPATKSSSGPVVALVVVGVFFGIFVCGGILVALLLPAVQAAREAARRSQCSNNLKQIALAFHNYHDVYGTLPPAYIPDEDGKPMHSWRVLILPFMEQTRIYDQYRFDEPWDSSHNQAVTSVPLPAYNCPSDPGSASPSSMTTNYMVVTGKGTVFEDAKAARFSDIADGTSNTLLVVEVAGTNTHWAAPVDLDAGNIAYPLGSGVPTSPGSRHPGGMNTAFCDGSVHFLADSLAPQIFQALLSKAGGEAINGGF